MKKLLVLLMLASGLALGCPSNSPLTAAGLQLGGCIVGAAASDIVEAIADPASLITAVISQCGTAATIAIGDLILAIEGDLSRPSSEASLVSTASSGIDGIRRARLQKVLAAAKQIQRGGK